MKTKQKFFYMVLGGVLSVAVLLIGMAISPLTAERNGSFGKITCTGLTVVNSAGIPIVRLSSLGGINISHADGTLAVALNNSIPPDCLGGYVAVYSKDETGAAIMSINKNGGFVSIYSKDGGKARGAMVVDKYGNGAVSTWDKNGYLQ